MSKAISSRSLGIFFAIVASAIFAMQDTMTKLLVVDHPVWFIVMARYWFHLLVAIIWASFSPQGLVATIKTPKPVLQLIRGVLLVSEIALIAMAFAQLGLAEVTTIMMVHPLIVTGLAVLVLGERVGWRRIAALIAGLLGLVIIMQPAGNIWGSGGLIALAATSTFAVYQLFTRMVSQHDQTLTSFFYAGAVGAVFSTVMGLQAIPPIDEINWPLLAGICLFSTAAHFSIIKALSLTFASEIQPYTYLQIVWSVPMGFVIFGDFPVWTTLLGAVLIISAGLYSIRRADAVSVEKKV